MKLDIMGSKIALHNMYDNIRAGTNERCNQFESYSINFKTRQNHSSCQSVKKSHQKLTFRLVWSELGNLYFWWDII